MRLNKIAVNNFRLLRDVSLGVLFQTAMSGGADSTDQAAAQKLSEAILDMQESIDKNFNERLEDLLPAFELFGYPGLSDPKLRTETTLDVDRLLLNHTKIRYPGTNGVSLPEAYNGLGTRNLIFILLKLHEFFKLYRARKPLPGLQLVFIEEPEAHLHPQMQEVFIAKLAEVADIFTRKFDERERKFRKEDCSPSVPEGDPSGPCRDPVAASAGSRSDCGTHSEPWPVQFVVTTHSSHVANRAPFCAMRYFLATGETTTHTSSVRTRIKDLSAGLGGPFKDDGDFLHQYMTLTRCDLLFADKAMLVEGTTERLLLPKMIEKVEAETAAGGRLSSQYVSIVEVGGAYAHRFFRLIEFLELRTLIITDLDSAKANDNGKYVACKVAEGTRTTATPPAPNPAVPVA